MFYCETCKLFKNNFFNRTPPVAASNITSYLKYTFPYLLNDLGYPWNSTDRVKTFQIIFANLYCCIWTSVSSLLFQWLKNIFFIPLFSRPFLPIYFLSIDSISHVRVVKKGGAGEGGGKGATASPPFPRTNFFFHVKSKNIKLSWNFYMRIKCETYVYLLNKT